MIPNFTIKAKYFNRPDAYTVGKYLACWIELQYVIIIISPVMYMCLWCSYCACFNFIAGSRMSQAGDGGLGVLNRWNVSVRNNRASNRMHLHSFYIRLLQFAVKYFHSMYCEYSISLVIFIFVTQCAMQPTYWLIFNRIYGTTIYNGSDI